MKPIAIVASLLWLIAWPGITYAQSADLQYAYDRIGELHAQGRYQEAIPFAEEALRLGELEFGPEHLATATNLNNLASLYKKQGRYAEAEPLYRRSLVIVEKAFGPDHPNFATTLENYADLLRKTGRADEAAEMEARAEAIRANHAVAETEGARQ